MPINKKQNVDATEIQTVRQKTLTVPRTDINPEKKKGKEPKMLIQESRLDSIIENNEVTILEKTESFLQRFVAQSRGQIRNMDVKLRGIRNRM